MATLDVIGIASILPFMMVLSNSELVSQNALLNQLFGFAQGFGVNSTKEFLFVLGLITFILLIFSLVFKSFVTYVQLRFALLREYSIGKRLIEYYLHQPYSWFLKNHSSDLNKNILSEVSIVIHHGIVPAIVIVSQAFVAIGVFLLLVYFNPKISIITIFAIGTPYLIIFFLSNGYLSKIGKIRMQINSDRFKIISEALNSIRELKINHKEFVYINRFSVLAFKNAKLHSSAQVISQLPRYILEIFAFGGILLIALFELSTKNNLSSALPTLSLYAFAGYRLMPIMQQIYSSATQFRFAESSINSIYNDLNNIEISKNKILLNKNKSLIFKKIICLKNVEYKYPDSGSSALKKININILNKSFIAIAGSSGSGKTTLVNIILGLLEPNYGTLEVDELVINKSNSRAWQTNIGYVPQDIKLLDDTIEANIAFGVEKEKINQESIKSAAKSAYLHDFICKELPNGYQTFVGENGIRLSGGQKQRIGIARALYNSPKVLILDEATSALDMNTEKQVMDSINILSEKILIIQVTHKIRNLENCNEIILLDNGSISGQGTFEDLINDNKIFRQMIYD